MELHYLTSSYLRKLYIDQKLSARAIAQKYSCSKSVIQSRLQTYNIPTRSKSEALKLVPRTEKYIIPKAELEKLYKEKKLSAYKIAESYNCSPSAIAHKLIRFNIPRRTAVEGIILTNEERCVKISRAVTKYKTKDFSDSEAEKAYLIGFRLGDMNVTKRKYGETLYVSSCTTKPEQLKLMKDLFKKFGHIHISKSRKLIRGGLADSYHFTVHLNLSFGFLIDKKDEIKGWILKSRENFVHFLAGYIDAEGSFGIYNNFGSFALGSYDKNIINEIYKKLNLIGIKTENPRIMVRGGHVDKRGVQTFRDLWSLRIRRKGELSKFTNLIEPYLRHTKRRRDLLRVKDNLNITI